ncbi:uncharacterized protein EI90DRAFT_2251667 [Cantharellus anzutake]|uniref:uncharacterized protein n=1 Tax=Cantharellus anzutake TaxID=1750568 RepID=UPI001905FEF8|nr:uncharacterized protein EI90DRAFT_2251667 [Cantharellus anzutake]KAF8339558.1 hypothetical protein EI90DRAFT_2251667 [Cantharellus anzutake]
MSMWIVTRVATKAAAAVALTTFWTMYFALYFSLRGSQQLLQRFSKGSPLVHAGVRSPTLVWILSRLSHLASHCPLEASPLKLEKKKKTPHERILLHVLPNSTTARLWTNLCTEVPRISTVIRPEIGQWTMPYLGLPPSKAIFTISALSLRYIQEIWHSISPPVCPLFVLKAQNRLSAPIIEKIAPRKQSPITGRHPIAV